MPERERLPSLSIPASPLSLPREKWYNRTRAGLAPSPHQARSLSALITFCTLFSGSSGNAVYFATDQGALLVDCGMSGRQVLDALCAAGWTPRASRRCSSPTSTAITSRRGRAFPPAGPARLRHRGYLAGHGQRRGRACAAAPHRHRAGESFFLNDLEIAPFSIRMMRPTPWDTASLRATTAWPWPRIWAIFPRTCATP